MKRNFFRVLVGLVLALNLSIAMVPTTLATAAQPAIHAVQCGVLNTLPGFSAICDASEANQQTARSNRILDIVNAIVALVVTVVGSLIVLAIIIAAIQLASSAGNPDNVKKAKERIFNAILGLVLLISLYAIFSLIGIAR